MSDDGSCRGESEWKGRVQALAIDRSRLDDVLDLLADHHRRYTLYYLVSTDAEVLDYDQVCEYLANDCPTEEDVQEQRVLLHHKTLPRLAEAGVVDFDSRSETIRYRGADDLAALVDLLVAAETDEL